MKHSPIPPEALKQIKEVVTEVLIEQFSKAAEYAQPATERKLVHGIAGLAKLLGCSIPTAQRFKESGIIPYHQIESKIIFDENEVLDCIKKAPKNP